MHMMTPAQLAEILQRIPTWGRLGLNQEKHQIVQNADNSIASHLRIGAGWRIAWYMLSRYEGAAERYSGFARRPFVEG